VIKDFDPHLMTALHPSADADTIEFGKSLIKGVSTFDALLGRIQDTNAGAVINLGSGSTVTLEGVLKSELTNSDFHFLT